MNFLEQSSKGTEIQQKGDVGESHQRGERGDEWEREGFQCGRGL